MNSIIPLEDGVTGAGVLTCELIYGLKEPDKEAQIDIGMPWNEFSNLDEDLQKVIKRRIANFWTQNIPYLWGPDNIAISAGVMPPRWSKLRDWVHSVTDYGDQKVPEEWMSKDIRILKIPVWFLARFSAPIFEKLPGYYKDTERHLIRPINNMRYADTQKGISTLLSWKPLNIERTRGVFETALDKFLRSSPQGRQAIECLNSIQNRADIKKVVCIGLGTPIFHQQLVPRCSLAQHTLARAIVTVLKEQFGHEVQLIAGDPSYGRAAKDLLESLDNVKFKIVHPGHGYQEHFSEIDDSTLVIALAVNDPVERVWVKYARPIAVITDGFGPEPEPGSEPGLDVFWYEVPDFERAEDYDNRDLLRESAEKRKRELQESDPVLRRHHRQKMVKLPGTPFGSEATPAILRMFHREYRCLENFTLGEGEGDWRKTYDLVDTDNVGDGLKLGSGHPDGPGLYWNRFVRMYVRK